MKINFCTKYITQLNLHMYYSFRDIFDKIPLNLWINSRGIHSFYQAYFVLMLGNKHYKLLYIDQLSNNLVGFVSMISYQDYRNP